MKDYKCKVCNAFLLHVGCGEWVCHNCDYRVKESITCENCGKREATQTWVGEGGVMDLVRGGGSNWCEICCVCAQLKYAKEQAKRIPELEKKFSELKITDIKEVPENE